MFAHRMLAYLIVVLTVFYVIAAGRVAHKRARFWARHVGIMVLLQVVVGIVTVMHAAPLGLALVHQAMALALFGMLIRTRFEAAYPSEQRIEGQA